MRANGISKNKVDQRNKIFLIVSPWFHYKAQIITRVCINDDWVGYVYMYIYIYIFVLFSKHLIVVWAKLSPNVL